MQRYLKNTNVFQRVIALFLIVMIPSYIFILIILHTSRVALQDEITDSMESRLYSYTQLLDSEINFISKLKMELLFDDEDLKNLSMVSTILTPYEQLSAINRLGSKLQLMKESSHIIEDIEIYIPNIGKTIGVMRYDDPMDEEEMEMVRRVNAGQYPRIISWKNQLVLAMYDPPYTGANTNYFCKIQLSPALLLNFLGSVIVDEERFFLTDVEQSWMVSDAYSREIPPDEIWVFLNGGSAAPAGGTGELRLENGEYFGAYHTSGYSGTTLMVAVDSHSIFGTINLYRYLFWIFLLVSVLFAVVYSYRTYLLIHRPLQKMVDALKKVGQGRYDVTLAHDKNDEFRYVYEQFNTMTAQLEELIHEVYEQKIYTQQAELKQLQSQINPHFLYNTFFVLHRMAAAYGMEDVSQFTDYLGRYFLFLTRTGAEEVPLEAEWVHAVAYTEIQKVRFANRIQVSWAELPTAHKNLPVPRMVIQPLLENAYKYALEGKRENGLLRVTTVEQAGCLCIAVEDNGDMLGEDTLAELNSALGEEAYSPEITGLLNVHRRLRLRYGGQAGLSFTRSGLGGLMVTVRLPVEQGESDV